MPSFDVVSELDKHEVTNAVDNAKKELERRYDLRGKCEIDFNDKQKTIALSADSEFQLEQVIGILELSLTKRKIDIRCLDAGEPFASGKLVKQDVTFKEGIDKELAKKNCCPDQGFQAQGAGRDSGRSGTGNRQET